MAPAAALPDGPIIVVVGLTAGWHERRQARRYFEAVFGRRAFLPWIPYVFGLRVSAAWLSLRVRHRLKGRNRWRVHLVAYIGGGVLVRWLYAKGERWPIGRAVWDRSATQERVAPALAARIPGILLTLAGYRAIVDLSRAFAAALPFPPSELGSGLIVETELSALARRLGIANADLDLSQEALDALLPDATAVISLPLSHDDVYSDRRFLDEAAAFLITGRFKCAQPGRKR